MNLPHDGSVATTVPYWICCKWYNRTLWKTEHCIILSVLFARFLRYGIRHYIALHHGIHWMLCIKRRFINGHQVKRCKNCIRVYTTPSACMHLHSFGWIMIFHFCSNCVLSFLKFAAKSHTKGNKSAYIRWLISHCTFLLVINSENSDLLFRVCHTTFEIQCRENEINLFWEIFDDL